MLSGYATILQDVSNLFRAFTTVMLSESFQVSKQSDAFANPSSVPDVLLVRISTLTSELRYSVASTYMLKLLL